VEFEMLTKLRCLAHGSLMWRQRSERGALQWANTTGVSTRTQRSWAFSLPLVLKELPEAQEKYCDT
jgi:hypothetical protein